MSTPTSATHKSVVVTSLGQYGVQEVSTPVPTSGQVLVKILAFTVNPNYKYIIGGHIPFFNTFPMRPGGGCIGRVEAVGNDALTVSPGQLVLVNPSIYGRDDPAEKIVQGLIQGFNPRQVQLATKAWAHGAISEKTLVPLENVVPVNEEYWLKTKGYPTEKIMALMRFALPYHGYELAKLKAGETVVVAFATGSLGNAAIELALVLGAAHVVGLGRTQSKLDAWHASLPAQYASRVSTVALTGDVAADTASIQAATPAKSGADVFFDLTPTGAAPDAISAHLGAGIGAMRPKGRVILMGNVMNNVSLPYRQIVAKDLQLLGAYLNPVDVPKKVVRLAESGLLTIDHYQTEVMAGGMDVLAKAMDVAEEKKGTRFTLLLAPN
ncbi:GroES-like protein [Clavulina sp. PMI_390]|nr:GroES-like protein [Clavulina sp. PMI_390]